MGNNDRHDLARQITEKLYKGATLHLINPQIKELEKLSRKQLRILMKIYRFPISEELRKEVLEKLGSDETLKCMEIR